jgi:hypothetical protein
MPPDLHRRKRDPGPNAIEGAKSKIAQSARQVPVDPGRTAMRSARGWRPGRGALPRNGPFVDGIAPVGPLWSRFAQRFVT